MAAVSIGPVLASAEQTKRVQQSLNPDWGRRGLMNGEPFGVDKASSESFNSSLWHGARERL